MKAFPSMRKSRCCPYEDVLDPDGGKWETGDIVCFQEYFSDIMLG